MRRIFVIMLPAGVGVWLGAMVFFSFAVAPTAFATLESRHQAGDLVAATLNILYLFGYVLGPLLVLASVVARPIGRQRLWGLRTILLVLMTLSALISREFVGTKLLALRRAMGPMIEKIPPEPGNTREIFQRQTQKCSLSSYFAPTSIMIFRTRLTGTLWRTTTLPIRVGNINLMIPSFFFLS